MTPAKRRPPGGKSGTIEATLRLAQARFDAGRDDEAGTICLSLLQKNPDVAGAYRLLGLICRRKGRLVEAARMARNALARDGRDLHAVLLLADIFNEVGNAGDATLMLRQAVVLAPVDGELAYRYAFALSNAEQDVAAVAALRRYLSLDPASGAAWCLLARAFRRRSLLAEALQAALCAVAAAPGSRESWNEGALILFDRERPLRAIAWLWRAIAVAPGFDDVHINLGLAMLAAEQTSGALAPLGRALSLNPFLPAVHGKFAEALSKTGAIARAGRALRAMVALDPSHPAGYGAIWHYLRETGAINPAAIAVERGHRLAPFDGKIRFQLGWSLLARGALKDGFAAYEARREPGVISAQVRTDASPQWTGGDPAGKRILLLAEQGFGDMIQFARFAPILAGLGAIVTLETYPPLDTLFRRSFPGVTMLPFDTPPPPHDAHLPVMSVARVLGTTLATIPAGCPYLNADPERVSFWQRRIEGASGPAVGLVWAGSRSHNADRLRTIALAPILERMVPAGVRLYSLQKEVRASDAEVLRNAGDRIIDLSRDLTDFAETAAAITALDLVVTVDTSVAHLAGALGRPVWLLVAVAADWRWLNDRGDSPWYPTMRIYRQERAGDWRTPLDRVRIDLAAFCRR